MKRFFFLFFLFPICIAAAFEDIESLEQDPCVFQHVNVISGHLTLSMHDTTLQGAHPFEITRTYSSSGALEVQKDKGDLSKKSLRGGWLLQGGWNFLPHANLLIKTAESARDYILELAEPSGSVFTYEFVERNHVKKNIYHYHYKVKKKRGSQNSILGARHDPCNNEIIVRMDRDHPKDFEVSVFLAGGGSRQYRKLKATKDETYCYYKLTWEDLPSGRCIDYKYDKKDRLCRIEIKNPAGNKVYSWIQIDVLHDEKPFEFKVTTSDDRSFFYKGIETSNREYFREVTSSSKKKEKYDYSSGREEMGARVSRISLEDGIEAEVEYYNSSKPLKERDRKFYEKHRKVDRVKRLKAPRGEDGVLQEIAHFSYEDGYTDVTDVDGTLHRYHHGNTDKVSWIEHFSLESGRHSMIQFLWKDERLIAKILWAPNDTPIFSKTFSYDDKGNVIKETLWGNITGGVDLHDFQLREDGSLEGADHYSRYYGYEPKMNRLVYEKEENGPSWSYDYKTATDLITKKITRDPDGNIIQREFFLYNDENFLVAEIIDDGKTTTPENLEGVHHRFIKRYAVGPNTGLIRGMSQLYLDLATQKEVLLQRHEYDYQRHNLKAVERVYDSNNDHRYTLYTEYDDRGNITLQTTARGGENRYKYNNKNQLVEAKEEGCPIKRYEYDFLGRPIAYIEQDDLGLEKITYSSYTPKGSIASQTNFLGNTTYQEYDGFGKCIRTKMPLLENAKAETYTPQILFSYDICGNLTAYTNPNQETTYTDYNVFQKPISVRYPDGTKVEHIYHINGSLSATIEPDGNRISYQYDPLGRVIKVESYHPVSNITTVESWEYDAFNVVAHIDPNGLKTVFTYDGAGRKIAEHVADRTTSYQYDALGFIEKTTYGDISSIEVHDVEGHVIESWDQKGSRIENHMTFIYNLAGLLEKSSRTTSQGEAVDLFFYDAEGRLCKHIDPLGAEKEFIYHPIINHLGQEVICKTTIDPLGYKVLEIQDACNRVSVKEKRDKQGKTVFLEEFLYDLAGNRAKVISTVYRKDIAIKKVVYEFAYDAMGRVLEETIAGKKTTCYTYDVKGNIRTKKLNSGLVLSYTHDTLGRLISLKSSDRTINYQYGYALDEKPIFGKDLNRNETVYRSYDIFGDITEEVSPIGRFSWEYDELGRCISFTLPDNSSIEYGYQEGDFTTVTRKGPFCYTHRYSKMDPNGRVEEEDLIYNLGRVITKHDLLERPYLQTHGWNVLHASYDLLGRVKTIDSSLFGEKGISYDPLGQLSQEGDKSYLFDSLGNSAAHVVNDLNEVISTETSSLEYDLDGNLTQRRLKDQTIFYEYDALGRLCAILYPDKKVSYIYDPFSRLYAKEIEEKEACESFFFLYDQDKEVGLTDSTGNILQLKVLGKGIGADIGAAIAIELQGNVYAPIHDFSGNCIGLVSPSGELVESYRIDAFGGELTNPATPQNPWRFSSKRHEEGLVFFGFRFYDCDLERWLTPDPAGFVDGMNLYVYVCNSPNNRLDLFGLQSEGVSFTLVGKPTNPPPNYTLQQSNGPNQGFYITQAEAQIRRNFASSIAAIQGKATIDGITTDLIIACGHLHQMQFSPEELNVDTVQIMDHFAELLPKEGSCIGLITYQNGINTSLAECQATCQSIMSKIPEGTLFIGVHNPSSGLFSDLFRAYQERRNIETSAVKRQNQFMQATVRALHKVNPDLIWLHICHSEAGVITRRAIEMLPQEDKNLMKKHLYCLALGPAKLIPKSYGETVYNVYSKKDYITKRYAKETNDGFDYDIKMVKCISPIRERTMFFADHAIMGKTYNLVQENRIKELRKERGFYDCKNR